ncbi:MAG: 16S rRNA (adenine(1518)-N(6)/adenine(1519)-N(6))-dimethyltransferase RsmA [Candidatus Saganbacteria bacterium]|nr:16S rRNA (adenine(1518)-N(6)/adenine(1519)-N(6))-dimethyltransferase RsmA [Candidatus Saganbacteria bacterium]
MPSLLQVTKELLATYNRLPRKSLSQNFLINPEILTRLLNAGEVSEQDVVIEIGTGLGVLTNELAEHSKAVITIETDKELSSISKTVLNKHKNIHFISDDFLKIDLSDLIQEYIDNGVIGESDNIKVVSNVPYHITTPIIESLIYYNRENPVHPIILIVLTIQKEVAERMASAPGSKVYGSLSVFVQYYNETYVHSLIGRLSFYPPPSVSSAILVLKPYLADQKPFVAKDEKLFEKLVRATFGNRRKQLRNTLAQFGEKVSEAGIDLHRRPETLSVEEFIRIVNVL